MPDTDHQRDVITNSHDYDAVVVGASLAGCATAIGSAGQARASRLSRSGPTRAPSSASARTSSRPRRSRLGPRAIAVSARDALARTAE